MVKHLAELEISPGMTFRLCGHILLLKTKGKIIPFPRKNKPHPRRTTPDALTHIVVEYNTVGYDLLQPALQRFLRLAWGTSDHSLEPGEDRTDVLVQGLGQQSFKFRSGLQIYSLQTGELVSGFVFQLRIIQRIFGIFQLWFHRQYPNLGMIGGLDKHALARGRDAMDQELAKMPFMLERGRYIPCLDHSVPNDVSWDDFRYFYNRLRELIWKYPPG